jgi:phosphotransferase system  glucose/maltose/N-acetylglucosamine-specific IIC component
MQNRTAAVIITIIAILLCGCPGLAALCLGLSSLADYAAGFGIFASDQNSYIWLIFSGLCVGIVLILITVLVSFFVLRRKKEPQPVVPVEPVPPTTPDEPLPPTI